MKLSNDYIIQIMTGDEEAKDIDAKDLRDARGELIERESFADYVAEYWYARGVIDTRIANGE